MRRFTAALFLVLTAAGQALADRPIIRDIHIVRHNVFQKGDLPLGLHGFLNSLHKVTVEDVIRRDVLFRSGEPLDTFLVYETARVMRLRKYIGDVTIAVDEVTPDSVDVTVETRDYWTFETSVSVSGGGGAYAVNLAASEKNFRGRAQEIGVSYFISDRRPTGSIFLVDPALFGTRIRTQTSYSANSNGNSFSASIGQPFWAVIVPWQFGVSVNNARDEFLFYKERDQAFAYQFARTGADGEVARAWGRKVQTFLGGGFHWLRQDFGDVIPTDSVAPEVLADTSLFSRPDNLRIGPSVGVRMARNSYKVGRFLDRYGQPEDFPTTLGAAVRVGQISTLLGSTYNRTQLSGQVQGGAVWGPLWLNAEGLVHWESDDGDAQGSTRLEVTGRVYLKPFTRQTLALTFHHSAWQRANFYGQTFVGALSGVRGLPARFYEGTRRWVANAEYRIYSPLRVLTIDLGGVLFTDVGQAWNRDDTPRLSDAPITYGWGLRLGFGKIAGDRVLRMDWARGPEGWITTFGFGMYFDFNLNAPLGF